MPLDEVVIASPRDPGHYDSYEKDGVTVHVDTTLQEDTERIKIDLYSFLWFRKLDLYTYRE